MLALWCFIFVRQEPRLVRIALVLIVIVSAGFLWCIDYESCHATIYQTMQRTSGLPSSSLLLKFHPQTRSTRHKVYPPRGPAVAILFSLDDTRVYGWQSRPLRKLRSSAVRTSMPQLDCREVFRGSPTLSGAFGGHTA